jgi:hypothetical protein
MTTLPQRIELRCIVLIAVTLRFPASADQMENPLSLAAEHWCPSLARTNLTVNIDGWGAVPLLKIEPLRGAKTSALLDVAAAYRVQRMTQNLVYESYAMLLLKRGDVVYIDSDEQALSFLQATRVRPESVEDVLFVILAFAELRDYSLYLQATDMALSGDGIFLGKAKRTWLSEATLESFSLRRRYRFEFGDKGKWGLSVVRWESLKKVL